MKTRVYIIDDHPLVRRGLSALIAAEPDLEVCGQNEDPSAGVQEIIRLQPDVVTIDISLNGSSGLELIKRIRAVSPRIQMVVLSMHHESVYALRALKAGARAYVMKHEATARIVEAIRQARAGRMFVSDEVSRQMLTQLVNGGDGAGVSPVATLSDRELEIVDQIGNGVPTREIAEKLHVSVKTVEAHRAHIKEKLNLRHAPQLVQFCVRWVEENKRHHELPVAATD
jgi:DNA-binding NarL/FixJ family response regulator